MFSATGLATVDLSDASSARPSSWTKAPIPDSSSERLGARALYEDFYCCIKEQQLDLFADRRSAQRIRLRNAQALSRSD